MRSVSQNRPMIRCTATKRNGDQCGSWAVNGMKVCRMHGGASPQAKKAAARRLQEQAAAQAVATLGIPVETTPTEALLEEVKWTAGHVQWLRERVQEVEQDALVWGRKQEKTVTGEDADGEPIPAIERTDAAGPSIWYELYTRERTHLVRVCAEAIKAGVEERRVRLAESQGELVAQVIRAILADLGLTSEQETLVATVVPRHLRLLAGGAA